jgi:hypothetical protein
MDHPGRGCYDFERELRGCLSEGEIQFTVGDIAPALGLLEGQGLIGRGPFRERAPRPGWLAGMPPEQRLTRRVLGATTNSASWPSL